jgi:hypothetical protein
MRAETLNATPVPSIMVQNGGVTEIEFSKETELANTRFDSFVQSVKLDENRPITLLYRKIMRWETDIDPKILATLKFKFQMPTKKHVILTSEKLQNLEATLDFALKNCLKPEERGEDGDTPTARAFKKLIINEWAPELNIEHLEELANQARDEANEEKLKETSPDENMVDDADTMSGM